MEIQILSKIYVHEDGVHCGKNCPLLSSTTVMGNKMCWLDSSIMPVVWHTEWQDYDLPERTDHCLAAEQDAKGMTGGIYPQDMPIDGKYYAVENSRRKRQKDFVAIANPAGWYHCASKSMTDYKDGDRFWPVKEVNVCDLVTTRPHIANCEKCEILRNMPDDCPFGMEPAMGGGNITEEEATDGKE